MQRNTEANPTEIRMLRVNMRISSLLSGYLGITSSSIRFLLKMYEAGNSTFALTKDL
jgi:hypothetical protein